jgi:hypothetical protein
VYIGRPKIIYMSFHNGLYIVRGKFYKVKKGFITVVFLEDIIVIRLQFIVKGRAKIVSSTADLVE